jgi:prepilin-type N-terminal cleavage/methylation domain-containing protein
LRLKAKKGFSLVEMMIVIAIIGIVLAIASPSFYKYRQNTNLKEATRDLAADISFWRQTAVSENVRYRIVFNQGANSYTIQRENPVNSGVYVNLSTINTAINDTKSPGSVSSSIFIMGDPNPPSFSGGQSFITFQPRGTISAGSVWLQHVSRLSTSTITTNLMGRVNVTYDLRY